MPRQVQIAIVFEIPLIAPSRQVSLRDEPQQDGISRVSEDLPTLNHLHRAVQP